LETDQIRIDLPIGSYVPHFVAVAAARSPAFPSHQLSIASAPLTTSQSAQPKLVVPTPLFPPLHTLTLMRPALLALLICTLLLRHQIENRGEYLRFWDRILSGRSAMVLSISPQDRLTLASSLYPLVWVAGRYGVDATLQGDSLTGTRPEALTSVQVGYTTPAETASDRRLRWALSAPIAAFRSTIPSVPLIDRTGQTAGPSSTISSAALLTILPEDAATLRVQGTDADAIRHLLEELTLERNFPPDVVERLDSRRPLQILIFRSPSGQWRRDIYWGGA